MPRLAPVVLAALLAGCLGASPPWGGRSAGRAAGHVYLRHRTVDPADPRHRHARVLSYAAARRQHWIASCERSRLAGLEGRLAACFPGEARQFVATSAYVVFASEEAVAECLLTPGGWAAAAPLLPEDKHAGGSAAAGKPACEFALVVFVAAGTPASTVNQWTRSLASDRGTKCTAAFLAQSGRVRVACKADVRRVHGCGGSVVGVDPKARAIGHFASQPEVYWIEDSAEEAAPRLLMEEVSRVLQSGSASEATLWVNGVDGSGELAAIGDTGIDVTSCFFADPGWRAIPFYPNVSAASRKVASIAKSDCECTEGGAAVEGAPQPGGDYTDEPNGHGTHAAGCLAGDPFPLGQDASAAGPRGMAFGAKLFFQDLSDASLPSSALRAVFPGHLLRERYYRQAYDAGARVHSSSWGTPPAAGPDDADGTGGLGPRKVAAYTAYSMDTDAFVWEHPDFLPVFGAGNDGRRGARTISAPGNAKNCLTVGTADGWAAGDHPSDADVAYFSSTGPTFDSRLKPDVVVPGVGVRAAYSNGPFPDDPLAFPTCSAATAQHSGTSVSTPIAAGLAVLVRHALRAGRGLAPVAAPRADLVKALVLASAEVLRGKKSKDFNDPEGQPLNGSYPSILAGHGMPRLDNVVRFGGGDAPMYRAWFDYRGLFTTHRAGAIFSYCFEVNDPPYIQSTEAYDHKRALRIVLAWTDYPAALFGGTALVTDLDLVVFDDNGGTWKGNEDHFAYSDDANNVEAVHVPTPVPGTYTVHVVLRDPLIAAVRDGGGQPFSIVVAGPVSANGHTHCAARFCPAGCSGNGHCLPASFTVDAIPVTALGCSCPVPYSHADCSRPSC
eukprot:gene9517-14776_t